MARRSSSPRRRRPSGRVLLRRLSALRSDRRFSPAMGAVADHAAEGGLVLGICNGFQILCEAGLLRDSPAERFSPVRLPRCGLDRGTRRLAVHDPVRGRQQLTIPVKHGEAGATTRLLTCRKSRLPAVRTGSEPERVRAGHRRRRQRGRKRARAHAPTPSTPSTPARIRRRRAPARFARGFRPRAPLRPRVERPPRPIRGSSMRWAMSTARLEKTISTRA